MRQIIIVLLLLAATVGQAQTKTSALVRGHIANMPEQVKNQMSITCYAPLQVNFPTEVPLLPDSLGRFEVEVPLTETSPVVIIFQRLLLSPGETYDVEMDGMEIKVVCKGGDASLTNQVLTHEPATCDWRYGEMDGKTDAFVTDAAEKELRRMEAANDSIAKANPTLSPEWRHYARCRSLTSLAQKIVQRHFDNPAVRQAQDGRLWQWLHDRFISNMPRPFMLVADKLPYTMLYYTTELVAPRNRGGFDLKGVETAIDIALEQLADGTAGTTDANADSLRSLRTMLNDFKALAATDVADSLLSAHPVMAAMRSQFSSPYLKELFRSGMVSERTTAENIRRIASLDMPDDVRDYARAVMLYNEMETFRTPLRPLLQELVGEVKNNSYRDIITKQSNHYRDLALRRDLEECLMPNTPLEGLTDGEEIFSKIIGPYRGRILYVDFWGTWCSPCKFDLKHHTHPLHQALADLPVTYLFLANSSPAEAWRSTIADFNLTGKHLVHYNLPRDQQQAVEQYLGVTSVPTYIIFDKDGRRVTPPDKKPRPYQAEAVRKIMLELMDK